jgi:hypothetical protein
MAGRLRTREWSGVDYYRDLGVAIGASRAAIDEAFRRQAKAWHPDRNPDHAAEERFKRVVAAYEVLRDPATREAYDDYRARIADGRLYERGWSVPPRPAAGAPRDSAWVPPARPAPRRRHRSWTLPGPVRVGLAVAMMVAGLVAVVWALVGELPSNSAGDTRLAVQITLAIMAAKLLGGGWVVLRYPQLRARWHRPPV